MGNSARYLAAGNTKQSREGCVKSWDLLQLAWQRQRAKVPHPSTDLLAGFPLLLASWLQGSKSLCPKVPGAEGGEKETALLTDGADHLWASCPPSPRAPCKRPGGLTARYSLASTGTVTTMAPVNLHPVVNSPTGLGRFIKLFHFWKENVNWEKFECELGTRYKELLTSLDMIMLLWLWKKIFLILSY